MSDQSIFALEALDAAEGDALLLHFGTVADRRLILIDGGPRGTYQKVLKPRLQELGGSAAAPLRLAHTLVTHLDGDHISGVLEMLRDPERPALCTSFWFNTFDDALLAKLPRVLHEAASQHTPTSVDTASVAQGMELRDAVRAGMWRLNGQRKAMTVLFVESGSRLLPLADGQMRVRLICPNAAHLERLAADWAQKTLATPAETQAYVDRSVYNLSSLVLHIEASHPDGHISSMLLTGDARGDHIIDGLQSAGLIDATGRCTVDVLKIPHHGSDRNHRPDFFDIVQARHYVISANGRHGNPAAELLCWIAEGARASDYRIWLTNRENPLQPALQGNIADALARCPTLGTHLRFREDQARSVLVDLWPPRGNS